MLRSILCVALCLSLTQTCEAQLLKRIFGRSAPQVGEACPNGKCPTSNNWTNRDGLSRRAHTEHVHGVNTAGMSEADIQQHQNDYHNTYGAGHPVRGVVRAIVSVPRAGVRAVVRAATYPSVSSQGYGSAGSAVQGLGSTGSVVGYGSAGDLVVGQPDPQGHIVTSINTTKVVVVPVPDPVPSQVCTCPNCPCNGVASPNAAPNASITRIGDRAKLMRVMLAAAREARGSSTMDVETVARMKSAMVDAALEELAASGQAIDIDKWIEIIEKLIPLILKLIELFGRVNPVTILDMQYVYDDSSLFHLAI